MKLSNKTYDILKWVSLLAIPLVTLIMSVSEAVGFEQGSVIAAIVSALGVFAGAVIKISTDNFYNDKGDDE